MKFNILKLFLQLQCCRLINIYFFVRCMSSLIKWMKQQNRKTIYKKKIELLPLTFFYFDNQRRNSSAEEKSLAVAFVLNRSMEIQDKVILFSNKLKCPGKVKTNFHDFPVFFKFCRWFHRKLENTEEKSFKNTKKNRKWYFWKSSGSSCEFEFTVHPSASPFSLLKLLSAK